MDAMSVIGPIVSVGSKLASAKAERDVGAAQRANYQQQAEQAELRGRSEAIAYKQKGSEALKRLNETLAAIVARAGAGGVDPTSGSAATVQQFAMGEGIDEFNIAADNAAIALDEGYTQGGIYRTAGETAYTTGKVRSAAKVGEAAYSAYQLIG